MKQALYKQIAQALQAYKTCKNFKPFADDHELRIESLVKNYMPSGSGIDNGIKLDIDSSTPEKLVFLFGYHHMNEGYYNKWTDHKLIVTPLLAYDFNLKITGENYNDVKEYLHQIFNDALSIEVE